MGLLAETKIRKAVSKDPNNTKWSRDTTTFGQKILRSQGWQPGEYLGVKDAPHSEFHTAANASFIRVALKDDMKGLGFDRRKEDEVTGADVFSDLLSRLNGKSEETMEEEKKARLVVKTHQYVETRWGPMRFVRGGLLVGDELKELKSDGQADIPKTSEDTGEKIKPSKKEKSKKRKATDMEAEDSSQSEVPDAPALEKKSKKEDRKSKKNRSEPKSSTAEPAQSDETKAKDKKKSKREKRRSDEEPETTGAETEELSERAKQRKVKKETAEESSKDSEDQRKESRSERKERKGREKKEKKRRKKEEASGESISGSTSSANEAAVPASVDQTSKSTPVESGTNTGTSTPRGNRNFVRSRFIAQKRQATLDVTALNQIFMIRA